MKLDTYMIAIDNVVEIREYRTLISIHFLLKNV